MSDLSDFSPAVEAPEREDTSTRSCDAMSSGEEKPSLSDRLAVPDQVVKSLTERSAHDHSVPELEGSPGHLIAPRLVDAMHGAEYMSLNCDAKTIAGIYVDGGGRAAITGRASRGI